MYTELKSRKEWDDEQATGRAVSVPIEEEFTGYNFLRNIWGTYFHNRHDVPCEDKLDYINKIVGMMKAQIRLRILSEAKIPEPQLLQQDINDYDQFHQLKQKLENAKQALERSRMGREELLFCIFKQGQQMQLLRDQNVKFKGQIHQLRQQKNRITQQAIELTKKIYELERGGGNGFNGQSLGSFLEQFSAITIDHEEQEGERRSILFGRKDSVFNLYEDCKSIQSEDDKQNEALNQLNLHLNLPLKSKNGMKQSLPCYYPQSNRQNYNDFLEQMKKIKQKTERIIGSQTERLEHRVFTRKSFAPNTERALPIIQPGTLKEKRFKRIR